MKRYSTLPRFPELEAHHKIQFNVIPRTSFLFSEGLITLQRIESAYSKPQLKVAYFLLAFFKVNQGRQKWGLFEQRRLTKKKELYLLIIFKQNKIYNCLYFSSSGFLCLLYF